MNQNIWLKGIMGVIVGDALGCPVQFQSREWIASRPEGKVTGMEAGGVYHMPEGTWTDDSSMTLAALTSIREQKKLDPKDIMDRFVAWYAKGEYTPFGRAFDMGTTCSLAIEAYEITGDYRTCGRKEERSNGNGSLMRIMPACLYTYSEEMSDAEATEAVEMVSGLTHNHLRSRIACGLYRFCVKAVLEEEGTLLERLQKGMAEGFAYYERDIANLTELAYYGRLRDLSAFREVPEEKINSTGYVVDSMEAAIWSLLQTENLKVIL